MTQEWISVSDSNRLPAPKRQVLAFLSTRAITIAWLDSADDIWWTCSQGVLRRSVVTHWQPLPEPPHSNELESK